MCLNGTVCEKKKGGVDVVFCCMCTKNPGRIHRKVRTMVMKSGDVVSAGEAG